MPDSPENNFCTLNPLDNDNITLTEGALSGISTANAHNGLGTTFGVTGGKWYWEIRSGGTGSNYFFGMGKTTFSFISQYTNDAHNFADLWCVATDGPKANGSGEVSYGSALSSGDILQLAFDLDNGKFYAGKNGTYFASGDPAAGSNAAFTNVPTDEHMMPFYGNSTGPLAHIFNFGQDSSFAGAETAQGNTDGNGIGDFYYAPPSGFLALCSANLSEPTIGPNSATQADDNFNTLIYDGNDDATRTFDVGFVSDWSWFKTRNDSGIGHQLYDSSRGVQKYLATNTTSGDSDNTEGVTSFNSSGLLAIGNSNFLNKSGRTHVLWNWKANGGTTSSNSDGSITSTVQANTTAGFSIVTFTGTGSNATVGHGLGSKPEWFLIKNRDASSDFTSYHQGIGATKNLSIHASDAVATSATRFNNTEPTDSVFTVSTSAAVNGSSADYVVYCFSEVDGYSKFGSYTGNGSADGTFVFTGFKPAWVMVKNTARAADWRINDTTRQPSNDEGGHLLLANSNSAEITNEYDIDFLSNGFKLRSGDVYENGSGEAFIYMAFAEAPFKYANAR